MTSYKLKLTPAAVEAAYCSQMALHSGTIRKVLEAALPHIEVEPAEDPKEDGVTFTNHRGEAIPEWDVIPAAERLLAALPDAQREKIANRLLYPLPADKESAHGK